MRARILKRYQRAVAIPFEGVRLVVRTDSHAYRGVVFVNSGQRSANRVWILNRREHRSVKNESSSRHWGDLAREPVAARRDARVIAGGEKRPRSIGRMKIRDRSIRVANECLRRIGLRVADHSPVIVYACWNTGGIEKMKRAVGFGLSVSG